MTCYTFASGDNRIAQLEMTYARGKPPHALCLIGPPSLPKEDLARHLSAALMCNARGQRPCGECRDCSRVLADTHGNLLRLSLPSGERSIKIEALRGLLDALSLHPQEEGPRVVIISDVQAMTVQAQNALLKSLEEPEASDHFILTASVEQAVLPTIRSRCEMHRLHDAMAWPTELGQALKEGTFSPETLALAGKTLFAVRSPRDIPAASALLRNERDNQAELLALVERQVMACLNHHYSPQSASPEYWAHAQPLALRRMINAVLEARKYRASNVSWQAVVDRLLFVITKEIHQCPLS